MMTEAGDARRDGGGHQGEDVVAAGDAEHAEHTGGGERVTAVVTGRWRDAYTILSSDRVKQVYVVEEDAYMAVYGSTSSPALNEGLGFGRVYNQAL